MIWNGVAINSVSITHSKRTVGGIQAAVVLTAPLPPPVRLPPDTSRAATWSFDSCGESAPCFGEGGRFNLPRIQILHASGDLLVPGSFDRFIARFIETLNQRVCECRAFRHW